MSEKKGLVQQFSSDVWWLVLLRGIALLILGLMLVSRPGVTIVVLIQFLGIYFLADGLISVFKSVKGRKYMQGWGWGIFMGVLEILLGIIVLGRPVLSTILTTGFLVYLVAFLAILLGIMGIITGIQARKQIDGEWAMIVGGVLAIIFGVILIMSPTTSAVVYLVVMGVFAVIGGIVQIFNSFNLRKAGKKGA